MSKGLDLVVVLILLMSLCIIALQPAKAQSLTGIIINADGSVTPSSTAIQMTGNTYIIAVDLNLSITIERGNIVVDGGNHTLQCPSTSQNTMAITLMASNVTIKNLYMTGWKAGVYGAFNNNTITNNVFVGNHQAVSIYADDYILSENIMSGSSDAAIFIDTGGTRPQGDNNLIVKNQITNNNWAIDILNSNGTTIKENNLTNNAVILTLGTQSANVNSAGFQLLYSNNFINNAKILHVPIGVPFVENVVPMSPAGQWDNGSIGNYWSDYLSKYPNATEIDHSGIGDTPYAIVDSITYSNNYANNTTITGTAILGTAVDRYPAIVPFSALTAPNPTPIASTPGPNTNSPIASSYLLNQTYLTAIAIVIGILVAVSISLACFRRHKSNVGSVKSP